MPQHRILIVDDDKDFVASTTALLESFGYVVSSAASGREGLEKVREQPPDLVILDVMMENDWAGYEVNETLHFAPAFEDVREIPILMVSSIPVEPSQRFLRSEEVEMVTPSAYLTKPLDIHRFLDEVAGLLRERRDLTAGAGPR